MKKGYFEIGLFLLLLHFGWNLKFVMTKRSHHHRPQNLSDCSSCPPGYGVERHCNRHHDTECTACASDHYSSHHSSHRPCYPCSRCGVGLYVAHPCTASKDTVCDSCHTYKGPHNENFYERCVKPLLDQGRNSSGGIHNPTSLTKESQSVIAVDIPQSISSSVVIASGVIIGSLAVILIATCFVVHKRRYCKRTDHRYLYEAVATQEAVML
ncbi:tumor necrosis factor receptor superfamily member 1B-like [Stegodyphus dumicola]|uniref:tumor necrosis factor receptor superfamily member 1B-like n=1 Tax=Stegodyphus dumicola TaxID=202533 RepID=UPI0015B02CDF|nr:tumor necrosis factor receptor superfamily member 1B-like [Stegodyphus dumicola]